LPAFNARSIPIREEVPAFSSADQAMDSRLPFGPVLFVVWKHRDVVGGVSYATSFARLAAV
jgi:hypothetical protein